MPRAEYINTALIELIAAAGSQEALAEMIGARCRETIYQSRVSHYLNYEGAIPLDKVPILLDIAKSLGVKNMKAVDLRPDLSELVK